MEMKEKIDHVVLLMLENRSLDNVLGWLYPGDKPDDKPKSFIGTDQTQHYHGLQEVTGITRGTIGATGTSVAPQPMRVPGFDPNEQYEHTNQQLFGSAAKPTNQNPAYGTPAGMAGFAYDFTTSSHWNPGDEDAAQHHQIIEAYTPDQLPILNGLAKSYAVSDAWFSSVPTETTPNRAFSICGTSLGRLDDGEADWDFYPQYNARTLWEALPDDISWAIYYHEIWTKGQCYTQWTFPFLSNAKGPGDDILPISYKTGFYEKARAGKLPNFTFLEPAWGYGYGKADGSGFDCPTQFSAWPGQQGNDYHPPTWLGPGEAFVNNVYTALTANSEAWKKTLLIITFDEHGGTYDHVDPGWNKNIEPGDGLYGPDGFRFDRYGVRVPTLLISPWIPEGTVFRSSDPDTTLKYDHTSLIATLLKWRGVDPKTAKLKNRVANAPTFEGVLADQLRADVPQYTVPAGYADQGAECMHGHIPPVNAIPPAVARAILAKSETREEVEARTKHWLASHSGGSQ
jgi:phospholipase C